jgi:SAM-dependent methyltransferase
MTNVNQNRAAWNRLAETGSQFANVATDEELKNPLQTLETRGWLPSSVTGLNVLCRANVSVVDLSPSMLALDQREAARRNLKVNCVETSMDDLSEFGEAYFDIVHQPVSTCYVSDIGRVYREIARVSKDNAIYISQHKQPTSLQIVRRDHHDNYVIGIQYYHEGPLPATTDVSYREPGAVEYMHRWDQLVGELCRSGFVLEDLREPYRGDPHAQPGHFRHRGRYIAPYVRLKARRQPRTGETAEQPASRIWTPGS